MEKETTYKSDPEIDEQVVVYAVHNTNKKRRL